MEQHVFCAYPHMHRYVWLVPRSQVYDVRSGLAAVAETLCARLRSRYAAPALRRVVHLRFNGPLGCPHPGEQLPLQRQQVRQRALTRLLEGKVTVGPGAQWTARNSCKRCSIVQLAGVIPLTQMACMLVHACNTYLALVQLAACLGTGNSGARHFGDPHGQTIDITLVPQPNISSLHPRSSTAACWTCGLRARAWRAWCSTCTTRGSAASASEWDPSRWPHALRPFRPCTLRYALCCCCVHLNAPLIKMRRRTPTATHARKCLLPCCLPPVLLRRFLNPYLPPCPSPCALTTLLPVPFLPPSTVRCSSPGWTPPVWCSRALRCWEPTTMDGSASRQVWAWVPIRTINYRYPHGSRTGPAPDRRRVPFSSHVGRACICTESPQIHLGRQPQASNHPTACSPARHRDVKPLQWSQRCTWSARRCPPSHPSSCVHVPATLAVSSYPFPPLCPTPPRCTRRTDLAGGSGHAAGHLHHPGGGPQRMGPHRRARRVRYAGDDRAEGGGWGLPAPGCTDVPAHALHRSLVKWVLEWESRERGHMPVPSLASCRYEKQSTCCCTSTPTCTGTWRCAPLPHLLVTLPCPTAS